MESSFDIISDRIGFKVVQNTFCSKPVENAPLCFHETIAIVKWSAVSTYVCVCMYALRTLLTILRIYIMLFSNE